MDEIEDPLQQIFAEHVDVAYRALDGIFDQIYVAVDVLMQSMLSERRILVASQGMSAPLAGIFCSQLLGRRQLDRPALPALNLSADFTTLNVIGEAYGSRECFSRQIKTLGMTGDTLLLIASSARENVDLVESVGAAHALGIPVVALMAANTPNLDAVLDQEDVMLNIPSVDPARVMETQLLLLNTLCALVEQRLFGH